MNSHAEGAEAVLRPAPDSDATEDRESPTPVDDATWFRAPTGSETLTYEVPDGALDDATHVWFDLFLDGTKAPRFRLRFHEGGDGAVERWDFHTVQKAPNRVCLPIGPSDLGDFWREGRQLKTIRRGDPVTPADVERITLELQRSPDDPVRWCQTPIRATVGPVEDDCPLHLPDGPIVDEVGQSSHDEWPNKSSGAEEVVDRLESQLSAASDQQWPSDYSRWGGWEAVQFEATGFFRTHHDGDRWWLVDPDGYPFWSAGVNCVNTDVGGFYRGNEELYEWLPDDEAFADAYHLPPFEADADEEHVNFLVANLLRAFGDDDWRDAWTSITHGLLAKIGLNTVGNWSTIDTEHDGRRVPYTRMLELTFEETPTVFYDFPDVHDPRFPEEARSVACALEETADDPAMLGYFLDDEPAWHLSFDLVAEGTLRTSEACATHEAFVEFLRERYESEAAFTEAWGGAVTYEDVCAGGWDDDPARDPDQWRTEAAEDDLRAFSTRLVDRFYEVLVDACRDVDPNHLCLGTRIHEFPKDHEEEWVERFDVFCPYFYRGAGDTFFTKRDGTPAFEHYEVFSESLDLPLLICEWHVGAYDVGLPTPGQVRVADQTKRADAYRTLLERAAASPWCVGAHWFRLYDQSTVGRADGENGNYGFLDVTNRPYPELLTAARTAHERLYEVADGDEQPYDADVTYEDTLFYL